MRIPRLFLLFILLLVSACRTAKPAPTLPPAATASSTPTELPTPTESPTLIVLPTETETPPPPAATEVIFPIDDFEAPTTAWIAGTEAYFADSSATSLALTGKHATQGKQALQLNFEMNDKPKAIFFLDKQLDLSQGRYLKFDLFDPGTLTLYNPATLASAGIAVLTGADKVWYESDGVGVGAGKQVTLSFDLAAATYKAESTNWEFRASIPDLNNVSRLALILYPARSGSVFVDNIRISDTP